jgi:hypothetical protein
MTKAAEQLGVSVSRDGGVRQVVIRVTQGRVKEPGPRDGSTYDGSFATETFLHPMKGLIYDRTDRTRQRGACR